jgi:putative heme transporter
VRPAIRERGRRDEPAREPEPKPEDVPDEAFDTMEMEERRLAPLRDRRRLLMLVVGFVVVVVAIYVLIPKVVGLDDALERFEQATWYWLVVALAFTVASFGAYVALFRGILGGSRDDLVRRRLDMSASYQITMAGFAATRIFSAAGAGGIALTYWALRRAGMPRRRSACRMVAFLALLYCVYLVALVLFGVLLRTGVLPGPAPLGGTIVPAAVAATVLIGIGLIALIPEDVERRLRNLSRGYRRTRPARLGARLAAGPATVATGIRTAIDYVRHPRRGALAISGAVGYWGAQIATLWASFEAFGGHVPVAVLVQGFFVGMAANLVPSPAGGVGAVDAGMIAAFLLFGLPAALVFPAVLIFRVMSFWLPIPPGVVAYFQLRRTVAAWRRDGDRYTIQSEVTPEAT